MACMPCCITVVGAAGSKVTTSLGKPARKTPPRRGFSGGAVGVGTAGALVGVATAGLATGLAVAVASCAAWQPSRDIVSSTKGKKMRINRNISINLLFDSYILDSLEHHPKSPTPPTKGVPVHKRGQYRRQGHPPFPRSR